MFDHPVMFFIHSSFPLLDVFCCHFLLVFHHMELIGVGKSTANTSSNANDLICNKFAFMDLLHCMVVMLFCHCELYLVVI